MNLLSPYFCASICLMALCFLQVALQIEAFSIDHIRRASTAASVCSSLTPATKVNYPASVAYIAFLVRFMSSSTQTPVCVFQPSVPADLSNAMKLIGQSGVPFAVSSGRHASNQGFSSTTGVQIDLSNFSNVTLSSDKSYVDVGAGNLWDNVYKVLDQSGVNIVGGRVAGVGVGGYITGGGGYSWKTNQYGLTVDTLMQVDMVLPSGQLVSANQRSNPDLFAAIKGGGNQFGVIYNFRLATNKQTNQIYGGVRIYDATQLDAVLNATAVFAAQNTDAKAQVLPTINSLINLNGILLLGFYDGPDPGKAFSAFDGIPVDIDLWKAQSFYSFVMGVPSQIEDGQRGLFHTISVKSFNLDLLKQVANQTVAVDAASTLALRSGTLISYDVEPFLTNYGKHANTNGPTMFPHSNSPLPLNLYYAWIDPLDDNYYKEAALASAAYLTNYANSQGQNLNQYYLYPNYCLASTTAKQMYGTTNAAFLRAAKVKYDPKNIMGKGTTWFSFNT